MAKIEDILPAMYHELHARKAFAGRTWVAHLDRFRAFVCPDGGDPPPASVLDFGCGPLGGLAEAMGPAVVPYDPYVERYRAEPWSRAPATFFSCDVFEHLTVPQLRWLVRKVCKTASVSKVFVALSTRAANKLLPNGLNAHLTVRPPDWWAGFFAYQLGQAFDPAGAVYDMAAEGCVFQFVRAAPAAGGGG